jgi:hypothetical protein
MWFFLQFFLCFLLVSYLNFTFFIFYLFYFFFDICIHFFDTHVKHSIHYSHLVLPHPADNPSWWVKWSTRHQTCWTRSTYNQGRKQTWLSRTQIMTGKIHTVRRIFSIFFSFYSQIFHYDHNCRHILWNYYWLFNLFFFDFFKEAWRMMMMISQRTWTRL